MNNNVEYDYSSNEDSPRSPRRNAHEERNEGRYERNRLAQNLEDRTAIVHIAELMGRVDVLPEILGQAEFALDCQELLAISRMSRMEDEERLHAYEHTFQKIQKKRNVAEAKRVANLRKQQNNAYAEGERTDRLRFHIQNTLKAKRNANTAVLAQTRRNNLPKNVRRILQQGRYAKQENMQRAQHVVQSRNTQIANLESRLRGYNAIHARLNGKHLPYSEYEAIAKELD
jgi:hypothetical protein